MQTAPNDILSEIRRLLDVRSTGRMAQTCRRFSKFFQAHEGHSLREYARKSRIADLRARDLLERQRAIVRDGKFAEFSSSDYITIDFILKNAGANWDWAALTCNSNITPDMILSSRHLPWPFYLIYMNPNIELADCRSNNASSIEMLSANMGITLQEICTRADWPWDWRRVSARADVNIDYVKRFPNCAWNWLELSMNAGITIHDIVANPNFDWRWLDISRTRQIPIEIILQNADLPWHWMMLSSNPCITMSLVMNNLDLPWDIEGLSDNPAVTISVVSEYEHLSWSWCILNMRLGAEFKEKYPEKLDHWYYI